MPLKSRFSDGLGEIFIYKKSVKNLLFQQGADAGSFRNTYKDINLTLLFGDHLSMKERLGNFLKMYFPKLFTYRKKIHI